MDELPPTAPEPRAPCGCVALVNRDLAGHNAILVTPIVGPRRAIVQTKKLYQQNRRTPPVLFATYCPFCGEKYPEARGARADD